MRRLSSRRKPDQAYPQYSHGQLFCLTHTAHVLGSKDYARATLTGNNGTLLDVEFSNENDTRGNTKGVAADNRGNVFKVSD